MKHILAATALTLALPAMAQEAEEPVTPSSVVAKASAEEWTTIAAEDLLVMELAPDARGNPRTVVIHLIPPPFSQPWVENIRVLASAHWWDGTSVYRVQDSYVVQWGDATEEKPLPEGVVSPISTFDIDPLGPLGALILALGDTTRELPELCLTEHPNSRTACRDFTSPTNYLVGSADYEDWSDGWPFASNLDQVWPIHCYGHIGVARDYAPDTGTGAELYTIIGQPQRHMDRNLAVVGRVIEGMEHLSSLPRGSGELGFYTDEEADLRTPIISVRLGSELPHPPTFEYLNTRSESFATYVQVRANRNDAFYTVPAGGVDVCSVQVPVRRVAE